MTTQSTQNNLFETVAYIHIEDKKLLLNKTKGKKAFYMPGGKIEDGETQVQALTREIKEELQIHLIPSSLKLYGVFQAQAYGQPIGTKVKMYCYTGKHTGEIKASTEIEEIRFFSSNEYLRMEDTAPAGSLVVKDLKEKNLID